MLVVNLSNLLPCALSGQRVHRMVPGCGLRTDQGVPDGYQLWPTNCDLSEKVVRATTSTCCIGGNTVSSCSTARLQRNVRLLLRGMGALPSMVMVLFLKSHRQPCSPMKSARSIVSSIFVETDARVRMRRPSNLIPVISI